MFVRIFVFCAVFLFPLSAVIAQQKPDKPSSTDENDAAVQGPVFDIGPGITPPKPILIPTPEYPDFARRQGIRGKCVLGLIVDKDGRTHDVHVIRSVDKRLDQNAINAAKQYKFSPAMKDGKPVAVRMSVQVEFRLYN